MTSPVSAGTGSGDWQVEQLRATAFFLPGVREGLPREWWANVVGGAPDEERNRAQEGTTQQFGQVSDAQLNVIWRSDRVDWRLVPVVSRLSEPASGFPSLGLYPERKAEFVELSAKGFGHVPDAIRVAFGAVLFKTVDDMQRGYEELAGYLPAVNLGFGAATDFLYQINRFRQSEVVESLVINRLTKWSMAVGGSIGISLNPDRGVVVPRALPPQHACRLELDMNTVPLLSPAGSEVTVGLFRELVSLGTEIAERGDVI